MEHVRMEEDRISHLPWEILDNILGRLPIRTTVLSTILSRKWRDKWIDISKLVFDDYSIDPRSTDSDKLARIVNHVLLAHRGTIETFTFMTQSPFDSADMDSWISVLRKCCVKELICDFSKNYTLPSCLFSFEFLKHLSLTNCWSTVPHKFTAFKGLVSLELKQFTAGDTVQTLIDNCPILENLVLSEICLESLEVRAPNLKYVHVEGEFKSVYLENSPHLTNASFKMTTETDTLKEMSSYKVQLPGWLSLIQKLALSGYFLRYLAARCEWRGINIACDKVEVLELDGLHFDQLEEMSLAFSILICSLNLKELHIKGSGPVNKEFDEFAQGLAQVSCCFNQLRIVKMDITRNINEAEDEIQGSFLEMIKLLVSRSPVLEKMHVHYTHSEKSDLWFMRELLLCERASSRLKLAYTSTHVPRQVRYHVLENNDVDWSLGVNYGYW